jgi:hypothetical protein
MSKIKAAKLLLYSDCSIAYYAEIWYNVCEDNYRGSSMIIEIAQSKDKELHQREVGGSNR